MSKNKYKEDCPKCKPFYCDCRSLPKSKELELTPEIVENKMLSLEREEFLEAFEARVGKWSRNMLERKFPVAMRDLKCKPKEIKILEAISVVVKCLEYKREESLEATLVIVDLKAQQEEGQKENIEEVFEKDKNVEEFSSLDTICQQIEKEEKAVDVAIVKESYIYVTEVSLKEEKIKQKMLEGKNKLSFDEEIRLRSEDKCLRLLKNIPLLILKEEEIFINVLRSEKKIPDFKHVYFGVSDYDVDMQKSLNLIRYIEACVTTDKLFFFRFSGSRKRSVQAYLDFLQTFGLSYGSYKKVFERVYKISDYFRTIVDFRVIKSDLIRKLSLSGNDICHSGFLYVSRSHNFRIVNEIIFLDFRFPKGSVVYGVESYDCEWDKLYQYRDFCIDKGDQRWLEIYQGVEGYVEIEFRTRSFISSNIVRRCENVQGFHFQRIRWGCTESWLGYDLKEKD